VGVIYLVRHGQSEWNVARLTQGQTVHPRLTALGREQAAAAAVAIETDLAGAAVNRIVTSDLVRALETAEVLGAMLDAPVLEDVRLREQHLGSFEGLGYDAMLDAAAGVDWTDPDVRIGGGETLRQLGERMTDAVLQYEGAEYAYAGVVTVIVSHGDAIRAALNARAGHAAGAGEWWDVPNGSVAVLSPGDAVRWLDPAGVATAP